MSELVRSFVAVDISDGARRQIAGLLDNLRRQGPAGVRWVKPELMHLTLAFLGEVEPGFIEACRGELEAATPQFGRFTAQLSGLGAFPDATRARVVWTGMKQGRDEVCALQQGVERALVRAGFVPERRPFSAHLTLGRLREPADVTRVIGTSFESEPFVIDRVIIFRSDLGPGGPTYSRIAEFELPGTQLDNRPV